MTPYLSGLGSLDHEPHSRKFQRYLVKSIHPKSIEKIFENKEEILDGLESGRINEPTLGLTSLIYTNIHEKWEKFDRNPYSLGKGIEVLVKCSELTKEFIKRGKEKGFIESQVQPLIFFNSSQGVDGRFGSGVISLRPSLFSGKKYTLLHENGHFVHWVSDYPKPHGLSNKMECEVISDIYGSEIWGKISRKKPRGGF